MWLIPQSGKEFWTVVTVIINDPALPAIIQIIPDKSGFCQPIDIADDIDRDKADFTAGYLWINIDILLNAFGSDNCRWINSNPTFIFKPDLSSGVRICLPDFQKITDTVKFTTLITSYHSCWNSANPH